MYSVGVFVSVSLKSVLLFLPKFTFKRSPFNILHPVSRFYVRGGSEGDTSSLLQVHVLQVHVNVKINDLMTKKKY